MVVRKPVPTLGVTPNSTPSYVPPYPVTPTTPRPSDISATVDHPASGTTSSSSPIEHKSAPYTLASINDGQYESTGNPWVEEPSDKPRKDDLPPALQVGTGHNAKGAAESPPPPLKPLEPRFQESTPKSSLESQKSDESWANVGDAEEEQVTPDYRDSRILQAFSGRDGPYRPNPKDTITDKPVSHGFEEGVNDIDRPLGSTDHSTSPSPPQAISRNPFRRKLSSSPHPQAISLNLGELPVSAPQPYSRESKGKAPDYTGQSISSQTEANPSDSKYPVFEFAKNLRLSEHSPAHPGSQRNQQPASGVLEPTHNANEVNLTDDYYKSRNEDPSSLSAVVGNPWVHPNDASGPADIDVSKNNHQDSYKQQNLIEFQDLDVKSKQELGNTQPSPKFGETNFVDTGQSYVGDAKLDSPNTHTLSTTLSSNLVTEAQLAKLREQRKETYQIKHFNWLDPRKGAIVRTSMLIQNQNGPCPLLALVNALILSLDDSAVSKTLRNREQVSLGLIIDSLMDELTTDAGSLITGRLPDVDELNRFLLMLHNGMNANPRLTTPSSPPPNLMDARNSMLHLPMSLNVDRKPGSFEETADVKLYSAAGIPLLHGWLPSKTDPAYEAFARSAPTYEDAQTIQFGEEELEAKLSQGGLTSTEQQLLQDIVSIKSFLQTYPTQLTPYGLGVINDSLYPGSFAILFRNDHFSTIYKHTETGRLFNLVTDAGYSGHDEVIWESLVDVTNKHSEFYSGDFRPVGNLAESSDPSHPSTWNAKLGPNTPVSATRQRQLSPGGPSTPRDLPSPSSPLQEQADADYALALQLQDEEEARAQQSQPANRRRSSTQPPPKPPRPIRSGTYTSSTDIRPLIPPRNQRPSPAVSRSAALDGDDDDAPPSYDEAAKRPAYQPPVGHPSHESQIPGGSGARANPGRSAPTQQVSPLVARAGSRQASASGYDLYGNPLSAGARRSSAYHHQPSQNLPQGVGMAGARQRDKECIVM